MPSLEITSCEQCPFHRVWSEHWMEAEYNINCDHPEQETKEHFTHKMKFSNSIYFKCPLEKKEGE